MANLKKHLAGTTTNKNNLLMPICGKVSPAIEYDTFNKEKFQTIEFVDRCKNCHNIHENK